MCSDCTATSTFARFEPPGKEGVTKIKKGTNGIHGVPVSVSWEKQCKLRFKQDLKVNFSFCIVGLHETLTRAVLNNITIS